MWSIFEVGGGKVMQGLRGGWHPGNFKKLKEKYGFLQFGCHFSCIFSSFARFSNAMTGVGIVICTKKGGAHPHLCNTGKSSNLLQSKRPSFNFVNCDRGIGFILP